MDPLHAAMSRLVKHPNLPPAFLALAAGIPESQMQELLTTAITRGWLSEHKLCCDLPPLLNVTAAGLAALRDCHGL